MSTRSLICKEVEKGRGYICIYCHFDGYPEGVGDTLLKYYNTSEKVDALIALGDISFIDKSIECPDGHSFDHPVDGYTVAYGRDRHDKNINAVKVASDVGLLKIANGSWAEYLYVWAHSNKWFTASLCNVHNDDKHLSFKVLSEVLKEVKNEK